MLFMFSIVFDTGSAHWWKEKMQKRKNLKEQIFLCLHTPKEIMAFYLNGGSKQDGGIGFKIENILP